VSGESRIHLELVKNLVAHIRSNHEPVGGFVIYSDIDAASTERPNRIGGHLPDVFASNVPATFRIIGEAKTQADLVTQRSISQIEVFLDYLALFDGSVFYLAVPAFSRSRAVQVISSVKNSNHERVAIEVLNYPVGAELC
jgi:hypothetical protein